MKSLPQLVKPVQSKHGKGWSAVYRDTAAVIGRPDELIYIKTQSGYLSRPAWNIFRNTPTLVSEFRAINICGQFGINVPEIAWLRNEGDVVELAVIDIRDGIPLDQYLVGSDPLDMKMEVVVALARQVSCLHRNGWIHGALGNEHILVQPDGSVTLIDFEKARWNPRRVKRDLARFWNRTRCLDPAQALRFNEVYRAGCPGECRQDPSG